VTEPRVVAFAIQVNPRWLCGVGGGWSALHAYAALALKPRDFATENRAIALLTRECRFRLV